MKKVIILIALTLSLYVHAPAQSLAAELEVVGKIILLKSDRNDVEQILAENNINIADDSGHFQTFSTTNAFIEISFSRGVCSSESDWNVPEWKVTQIEIIPRPTLPIMQIGFDYSNFRFERLYKNMVDSYIYHDKNAGIAFEVDRNTVLKIRFFPPKSDVQLSCNSQKANKFYSKKQFFADTKLQQRIFEAEPNYHADIGAVNLSASEIEANCVLTGAAVNRGCAENTGKIFVKTEVNDREADVLIFVYTVSGGQIIGKGENVVWDLSEVKPGTYSITAAVDDGCGFCGKSLTKTIVVRECTNCR